MLDSYNKITVGGKEYPIAFTLNTMEQIQQTYGSFEKWSTIFFEMTDEIPYKDLIWSFEQAINEGIEIDNEEGKSYIHPLTHRQVGRLITAFGQLEAVNELFKLVKKSMPKEEDSKNLTANPTQQ